MGAAHGYRRLVYWVELFSFFFSYQDLNASVAAATVVAISASV